MSGTLISRVTRLPQRAGRTTWPTGATGLSSQDPVGNMRPSRDLASSVWELRESPGVFCLTVPRPPPAGALCSRLTCAHRVRGLPCCPWHPDACSQVGTVAGDWKRGSREVRYFCPGLPPPVCSGHLTPQPEAPWTALSEELPALLFLCRGAHGLPGIAHLGVLHGFPKSCSHRD